MTLVAAVMHFPQSNIITIKIKIKVFVISPFSLLFIYISVLNLVLIN